MKNYFLSVFLSPCTVGLTKKLVLNYKLFVCVISVKLRAVCNFKLLILEEVKKSLKRALKKALFYIFVRAIKVRLSLVYYGRLKTLKSYRLLQEKSEGV